MSKAVLILDMPDMCIDCQMSGYSDQGRPRCNQENRHLDSFCYKPDWCPLIELPKRRINNTSSDYLNGYADGFNGCIDEILGE